MKTNSYTEKTYLDFVFGIPGVNDAFDRMLRGTMSEHGAIVRRNRGSVSHIIKGKKPDGRDDFASKSDTECQQLFMRHFHASSGVQSVEVKPTLFYRLGKIGEEDNLKVPCTLNLAEISDCPWDEVVLVVDPVCGSSENRRRGPNVFCNACIAFRNKRTGQYEVPGFCSVNAITAESVWSKPGTDKIWYRGGDELVLLTDSELMPRNKPLKESKLTVREALHKYTPTAQKLLKGPNRLFQETVETSGSVMANTWELMKNNCGGSLMTPFYFDKITEERVIMPNGQPKLRENKAWDSMNTNAHEYKAGYIAYHVLENAFKPTGPLFEIDGEPEAYERLTLHATQKQEFVDWVYQNNMKIID